MKYILPFLLFASTCYSQPIVDSMIFFPDEYLSGIYYEPEPEVYEAAIYFNEFFEDDTLPHGDIRIDINSGNIILNEDTLFCDPRLTKLLFRIFVLRQ